MGGSKLGQTPPGREGEAAEDGPCLPACLPGRSVARLGLILDRDGESPPGLALQRLPGGVSGPRRRERRHSFPSVYSPAGQEASHGLVAPSDPRPRVAGGPRKGRAGQDRAGETGRGGAGLGSETPTGAAASGKKQLDRGRPLSDRRESRARTGREREPQEGGGASPCFASLPPPPPPPA